MKKFSLVGVNVMNEPVQYGNEVVSFTGHNDYFSIVVSKLDPTLLLLSTPVGTYNLEKHATANRYQGVCNGHKVHVTLKKIVGELIFW